MQASFRTAMFGLAILSAASTASAVSLASFTPRIDNLPQTCRTVYTTAIEGCTANDFTLNARCSSACIQGLVKIAAAVNRGCVDVDVGETSIIGVFQNGFGIQALCPGVSVTTILSSTALSTKAPAQTSMQPPAQTSAPPPVSRATTASTSSLVSSLAPSPQTQVEQSSSTSSEDLATDPDATSILATSVATGSPTNVVQPSTSSTGSSAAAGPTQAPKPQLSNADSGGGSPFDVVAAGSSLQFRVLDVMMAAFLATALRFIVSA